MDTTTISNEESPSNTPKKKKKGLVWLLLLLLLLLFALCGTAGYYFYQRELPKQAVEEFLKDMQKMNFDGMASHLQSSDLSALDNADVRNEAYEEFFRQVNEKISYEIVKNSFDFKNGTASVTVSIKYIDGSNIYREAINEFLRQIVSAALSGEDVENAQTQAEEQLASILLEKADSVEDTFANATLTYPLIRENGTWKIVALDDDTVKVMSANFKNAAEEIDKTLNESASNDTATSESPLEASSADDASDAAKDSATESQHSLSLSADGFTLTYSSHKTGKDVAGKPCLLFYYNYTNTSDSPSSAMVDVHLGASQDGKSLTAAIPEKSEEAIDRFFSEVAPGETVTICQVFSLDGNSDVTVQAESASDTQAKTASQVLKIK